MKTVATFHAAHEAHMARGILENEGIPAVVIDEHTVQLNAMYADAIGGVKLQVLDEDCERALEILGGGSPSKENPPEEELPADACPKCGSSAYTVKKSRFSFLLALFAGAPDASTWETRVCRKCGAKW